jgi:serine/threonine-protein kinase HipA
MSDADVYKGDVKAGTFTRVGDDVVFAYDSDYVDAGLPAVCTTIPLRAREVRTSGGAVPAFFAGLLPEGRRLTSLQRSLKVSADDELAQLLVVGADCVGDVRVLPAGASAQAQAIAGPPLPAPHEVSFAEFFDRTLENQFAPGNSSIPGVQDKLSGSLLALPVTTRGAAAILKLNPAGYPRLVENEAYFLDVARRAGLKTPRSTVVHDRDGASGLIVERFDRTRRGRQEIRIAQEDSVQLAGRWPSAKYSMTTREVFDAVTAVTPAAPVARAELLRLFIFSYLVFNGDLHGKNVSVYDNPEGVWSVTPAYDLVSTLPYGDDRMALQLDGRDSRITGAVFEEFADRVGTRPKVTRTIIESIVEAIRPTIDGIDTIGLDEQKADHLKRKIRERIAEMGTKA